MPYLTECVNWFMKFVSNAEFQVSNISQRFWYKSNSVCRFAVHSYKQRTDAGLAIIGN